MKFSYVDIFSRARDALRQLSGEAKEVAMAYKEIVLEFSYSQKTCIKLLLWFFLLILPLLLAINYIFSVVGIPEPYKRFFSLVLFTIFSVALIGDATKAEKATKVLVIGFVFFFMAIIIIDSLFGVLFEMSKYHLKALNLEPTPERILQITSIFVNAGVTLAILWLTAWQLISYRRQNN